MKHPLEKFKFCPVCGSSNFKENNFKSKKCGQCGFTYYANPSSATAAFILNEKGQLLVARRAKEPAKGTLDLVGGFVDMDETVEEGMKREILEESGLSVDHCQYLFSIPNLYEYSGMQIHTLDMFFLVHVSDTVLPKAEDDVAELMWKNPEDLKPEDFGLNSIRKAVTRWLSNR